MIDFSQIKAITIPEGIVNQISRGVELLWRKVGFEYTGDFAESSVEIDGAPYTLYTLTTSGLLTVYGDGIRFWMCGSGAGGKNTVESHTVVVERGYYYDTGNGGGGGYVASGDLKAGEWAVVIGAGGPSNADGNATSISAGKTAYSADGGKVSGAGGSGGGSGLKCDHYRSTAVSVKSLNNQGKGAGVSTYPFGLTELFAHCPGGGGGSGWAYAGSSSQDTVNNGGNGGTNGGNGSGGGTERKSYDYTTLTTPGGTGGVKGGGNGGGVTYNASAAYATGKNASFYGSGAGGGAYYRKYSDTQRIGTGGIGYQGVVYIAVPA